MATMKVGRRIIGDAVSWPAANDEVRVGPVSSEPPSGARFPDRPDPAPVARANAFPGTDGQSAWRVVHASSTATVPK